MKMAMRNITNTTSSTIIADTSDDMKQHQTLQLLEVYVIERRHLLINEYDT